MGDLQIGIHIEAFCEGPHATMGLLEFESINFPVMALASLILA